MTSLRSVLAPLAVVGLVLAACGDDDGEVAVPGVGTPEASESAPSSADDPVAGDAPPLPSEDPADLVDDAADLVDDTVDEDLVEDVLGGDTEDLDDMLTQFNTGEGGGTITIDGAAYTFTSEVCIAGPMAAGSFVAEGPGTGPDGQPFWGTVSLDRSERSELEDFMDDAVLDTMFPDGATVLEDVVITATIGQDSMFAEGDESLPAWEAATLLGESVFGATVDYSLDGTSLSGSGQIIDLNAVATPFGELVPFQFTASCS